MNKNMMKYYKEGQRSYWSDKIIGHLDCPYSYPKEPEKYLAWVNGHRDESKKEMEKDREELNREVQREYEKQRKANEEKERIKRMKKTKKGRAELAGQTTLF